MCQLQDGQAPWVGEHKAGVDEVGIGPLAGPVVAAAVVLDPTRPIAGLTDSKKLTPKRRLALFERIKSSAAAWAVDYASVAEIDELNILRASHLAMQRAVQNLAQAPHMVFVDGNKAPQFGVPCVAVIKGDLYVPQISAASILAKVVRDEVMGLLAEQYPGYGVERHMGYPTKAHREALQELGPTPMHRTSFAPVRALLGEAVARPEPEPALNLATKLRQFGGWEQNHV